MDGELRPQLVSTPNLPGDEARAPLCDKSVGSNVMG